ncbi:MAG: hypothetical protein CMB60_03370 [Euryarchaeota archaeon]|nr:hypothetical protein [Euryarchaeota archaeon]
MDRSRARQVAIFSSMLVVVIFSPITANAGESNNCCEDPDKFDLFLIGDPDNGLLTPFESDLEERKSVEVTSSLLGEVEIGSWMIEWGEAGSYSSGTWTFSIPYEVSDSTGVSANATVVVKVGGNTYESSSQLPAVYLSESGELQVDVEVQNGEISKNEKIEVTFSVRSLIFSNPGSESGIVFHWGEKDVDAAISISFPLVNVVIREASVKGDLVFFPIRLTSGFGDKIWTGSTGGLMVQNVEISESPIVNSNEDWVDVTFVWEPSGSSVGTVRTDFQISLQDSLVITVDKIHEITLGQDTGDNSWYPEEEPPRTGGSDLMVEVNCEYDGNNIERKTTITLDGAMSQWMRWGLDNIGNKSLGSKSWWRNLNTLSDSVSASEKSNARVDNSELSVLESHLKGARSNLKSFLSDGLKIDSESLFGLDPIDHTGPLVVSIDLGPSRAFNSDDISIYVESSYPVERDSRQTLIEDFIRHDGYDYWEEVDLSFEIRTGMLSGFDGVNLDNGDVDYTHRRWIIMEILTLEESGIESDTDFRLDFEARNALLFSPLISAMISVFALCLALGIGMALTKRRSRVPSMIMIGVLGVLSLSIYWFGLPMPIVLGVVGSSVLLVFPAAVISPVIEDGDSQRNAKRGGRVKCPSCGKRNAVESDIRPLRIECVGCSSTLRIE